MCFDIEKLWCFSLNIIGYFFSLLYAHAWYARKKKNMQRKIKSKISQNAFKYGCKRVSRRCGSYRMYLKGDSSYQVVMIVCEWNWFSYISNLHNMRHLCTLAMFYTQHAKIICYFWYMCRYNVIWPSQGIRNIYSLNYLNLFLKYKIG